jgi:hypothetical protein
MAAQKYIDIQADGSLKQIAASSTSTGVADDGKIVALDSTGKIDSTMMPVGIGADIASIVSFEDLSAGDFVNVFDNAATPNVRKADATTTGKKADGFVLDAVTAPAAVNVYFEGTNTQVTGQTVGANIFLATTAGGTTSTAPTSSGNNVQRLGRAISATAISFEPAQAVELA